jgi:hypothetical protein
VDGAAPQVGFSAAIRKIRFRTSREILLLPIRLLILEIMLRYKRKPALGHQTTVSGATTSSDLFPIGPKPAARTPEELIGDGQFGPLVRRLNTPSC